MGVPVVTLVGPTVVGRAGLCQLMNLGLPELIASSPEEYVRVAAELAQDLPRLSDLRATLRDRMQASPLMDAPRFARNLEAAYRAMWKRWCRSQTENVSSEPASVERRTDMTDGNDFRGIGDCDPAPSRRPAARCRADLSADLGRWTRIKPLRCIFSA